MTKGPGAYLKEMFSWFFLNATADCPCEEHAAQMDAWGPDGCSERMETILDWIQEEATRRRLPFSRILTERLVRICIWRSRRQK
jgi:hypothetical protein